MTSAEIIAELAIRRDKGETVEAIRDDLKERGWTLTLEENEDGVLSLVARWRAS